MTRHHRTCLVAAALAALLGPGAGAQDTLDAAGIEAAMAGATTRGINTFGNPYTVRFLADGTLEGVAGFSDEYADGGTWWIEGDSLCRRWTVWLEARPNCFVVTVADGQVTWTDTLTGTVVVEDHIPPP